MPHFLVPFMFNLFFLYCSTTYVPSTNCATVCNAGPTSTDTDPTSIVFVNFIFHFNKKFFAGFCDKVYLKDHTLYMFHSINEFPALFTAAREKCSSFSRGHK